MTLARLKNLLPIVLLWLAWPYLYLRIALRRQAAEPPARILVIPQLTRVGDLVCATPVFAAIKARYPAVRLSVMVSKKVAGIVKHNPHIDEIILIEDYSFFALARKIRDAHFDWSVSLVPDSMSALLAVFGLVPERLKTVRRGRPASERLTDWASNHRAFYEDHTYLPGHYLSMLAPLDIHLSAGRMEVFPTPGGERKARKLLERSGAYVGISITAGNTIKEWGDERFIELARALHERYVATLVFIGAPADRPRIERVAYAAGAGDIVATDFSLEELPALMGRFALFIAVDTGPIYIAHALGVSLIDIIGPVDPTEQPPLDEKSVHVLPADGITPSSFVFKRPGQPEEHARAVVSISVSAVMEAVATLSARGYGALPKA